MKNKSIYKMFFFIFVLSILSACKSKPNNLYTVFNDKNSNHENIAYQDNAYDGDSVSYGILNTDGYIETNIVYNMEKDNSFEKKLIANFINIDTNYSK